ncbi:MAG: type II toxin-antitoxin system mRNA interferase toxin, RelE/StbE family [Piscirickettsiaceae bacterium CG_4_9_14_3_um_filter_43_564]|nr:type II toxin-antitoxin system RelE/ParE family toxin [Thiomicrospira sp.]OIP96813.1 MAG: plasmid stabilization protein [Thiomicrospira sp. CG2_30_44_34]PIQ04709.1 MAG: type II toxin-antitoxin system mRNA interferase toxin, RelE/StbE family [Piscirickettsiaceae bacterium CG18_big_fil_WC_8_21_14_2_50_44_103]PIU39353.1 MAG: type II toxin-antitoxin system mRNA interferase toxin, RelE/StbE family [Piscirickettsiaceae bacterium CG07_land_8_20_14_0_80_44_28]PIW56735.1 MAG: type II toxin-antitoxin 
MRLDTNPVYQLVFDDKVIKDLKKIDKSWQRKILNAIQTKLTTNPYAGKKLVGDLSPFYRLRVGDYRVIYEVVEQTIVINIIRMRHRKDVYLKES